MKTIMGLCILTLFTVISNVNALVLWTFKGDIGTEIPNRTSQLEGERSVFKMIEVVNTYLRFAIGFVCFLFMVINGYKLISANGDEKQTKAATSALIGSIVGIFVCLLAYIIVNLAVKLFA